MRENGWLEHILKRYKDKDSEISKRKERKRKTEEEVIGFD